MSMEQFTIGENRARPPYQVKTSRCVSCDGPIPLYSEKSQLVTCEYCGEKLDCSTEELKALGKNDDKAQYFRFDLHQECSWNDTKYKVIARIRSTDKWDATITDYLLFHPFQGTMWVSVYDGEDELEFAVSQSDRLLSKTDPFSLSEGNILETEDGQEWRWDEVNQIQITYVDGALPWLAKIGDSHSALELTNTSNKSLSLCVEKSSLAESSAELEYSIFKTVSKQAIYKAFGKEAAPTISKTRSEEPSKAIRVLMQIVAVMAAVYFVISCFMSDQEKIATFHFTAEEVGTEILSPTFELDQTDIRKAVDIIYAAGIDNEWLSLNIGVVSAPEEATINESYQQVLAREEGLPSEQQTKLRHLSEVDISYYHGTSGGESWSEGSSTEGQLLVFSEAGKYRILLTGISGSGETAVAKNRIPLTISIYKNAHTIKFYLLMAAFSVLTFVAFRKFL